MSPHLIGAAAGAAVGLASGFFIRSIADKIEREKGEAGRSSVTFLRMIALIDIILLTLMGAFVGPLVLGAN
jgi:hypothetical protein